MVRKRSRRAQQPQPSVEYKEPHQEPLPEPEATSTDARSPDQLDATDFGVIASMSFDALPDEVPSLDDLPPDPELAEYVDPEPSAPSQEFSEWEHTRQPEQRVAAPFTDDEHDALRELAQEPQLSDADLNAESTSERQDLVDNAPALFQRADGEWLPAPEHVLDEHAQLLVDEAESRRLAEQQALVGENEQLKALCEDHVNEIQRLSTELATTHEQLGQARDLVDRSLAQTESLYQDVGSLNEQLLNATTCIETRDRQIANQAEQIAALIKQEASAIQTLSESQVERDNLESRLVDSELTRADLESQLDVVRLQLSEFEATRSERKLWHLVLTVAEGQKVPRVYVLASTMPEAIDRAVKTGVAEVGQITNVMEIKDVQVIT